MRPGRQFLLLSAVAVAGAILVRPGDLLPVAGRFIAPLFAQQQDTSASAEPVLPDFVPDFVTGGRALSFAKDSVPAPGTASQATAPAATSDTTGAVALPLATSPPSVLLPASAQPGNATSPSDPQQRGVQVNAALSPSPNPAASGSGSEIDGAPARTSVVTQIEPIVPGGAAAVAEPPVPLRPVIAAKTLFGAAKSASPLAARAIGSYARGCLAGAVALPVDGPAWQAMRLSRNRNWGHPKLIALVEKLATDSQKLDGWPGLLVGDIAQPRGGPMLTGHASHQIGLDADVWLTPMPNRRLTHKEREDIAATSMLDSTDIAVDPKIFTADHVKLIKRAASYPQVERVLVHPAIKKALCTAAGTDRKWLGKVRPIGGHYYHFHIRMACPPGFGGCLPQKAPTGEDGCTKEVDDWIVRLTPPKVPAPPPPPGYKPPPPKPPIMMTQLPTECTAVLESGPDGIAVPPEAKIGIKLTVRTPAALRPHVRKIHAAAAKK